MSEKKLGLFSGTTYAIGSIIGSGILFLPSLTYKVSGSNVFLSWLLATLLCVPLLIMFYDMAKLLKTNDGVKGFIELGLGHNLGAAFPTLMLSTVSIGMPSSALIVGKFVQQYLGISHSEFVVAFYLLIFGIVSNLMGRSIGEKIQNIVSISFLVVGISLFFLTLTPAKIGYHKLTPNFNPSEIFSGITLAFWAFAGFENLTFITQDFNNPKRDFLLSMIISLIVCGALYLGITANYAALIAYEDVQSVMGIFQLSQVVEPKAVSGFIIVALSVFALKTNLNSWVRGLSGMIRVSSEKGHLPGIIGKGNRPLMLLGSLFTISLTLSIFFPNFLETGLLVVSSNFVVIYVLCTISFLKVTKSWPKRLMAVVTLAFLMVSLASSGNKLIYPGLILAGAFMAFKFRKKLIPITAGLILLGITPLTFAAGKKIKVALIFRFDNKFNGSTISLNKGLELAKKVYERNGKLKVTYTRYAHDENLSTVISAAQKAVQDGHFVIIGGENSDEALAIAEVIKDKNIVLITPTATNPKVTSGRPFVFRTCISDDKVADKLAKFVFSNLKAKTIGILHNVSSPYSDYLSKRFSNQIYELIDNSSTSQSQRPKVIERKIIRNQNNFSSEVKYFNENKVDHLILLSFQSDLLRFQSQAIAESFSPTYVGSDGWGVSEAVQKRISQSKFLGFRNAYWDEGSKSKQNIQFKKEFKSEFKEEANPWTAITFDSAKVLFDSFLSNNTINDGEKLRQALKSYQGKNLLTTDAFSFDENNTPTKDVIIYKIENKGVSFYGKI